MNIVDSEEYWEYSVDDRHGAYYALDIGDFDWDEKMVLYRGGWSLEEYHWRINLEYGLNDTNQ